MADERTIPWRNDHVSIVWDNPEQTAVLITYQKRWSWDDAHTVYDVLVKALDGIAHKVHLLIHFANSHWFPTGNVSHLHRFMSKLHTNIGHVFIIGFPRVFCDIFTAVVSAYPGTHLTVMFPQTLEEARLLLPSTLPPATSNYTLNWVNVEKTIIELTLHEGWKWEDVAEARQYYGQLIDGLRHTVDVIVDTRRSPRLPQGFSPNLEKRYKARHSRTGVSVFVGSEPLYQDAMKAFYEHVPDLDALIRFADSIENAEAIITQVQARRALPQAGVWAQWDNPEHTRIYMMFCGKWQWDDVHDAAYRSRRMMDTVTHKVDFIIDLQPPNFTPPHFMTHVGRLFALVHPRLGVIALVKPTTAWLFNMFCKLNNSLNIQYIITQNVEEAREILDERQARR